jgi:hypothetical protein
MMLRIAGNAIVARVLVPLVLYILVINVSGI